MTTIFDLLDSAEWQICNGPPRSKDQPGVMQGLDHYITIGKGDQEMTTETGDRFTIGAFALAKELGINPSAAKLAAIYHALKESWDAGQEVGIGRQQREANKSARIAYLREQRARRP